jgi:ribosomal protein S18 acetylase RimI-like enzyme
VPDSDLLVAVTDNPADADELAHVAAATFPLACPPELTADDIADFVARNLSPENFRTCMADPEQHVFTATDASSGRIVGYALLVDAEPDDSDVRAAIAERPLTMVSKLYVLPGFHGRSVSTALMSAALDHAAERRSARIWLGVNDQNRRAQRFYEKMGFAIVGRKSFVVNGKTCSDFVLARTPPQPG